MTPPTRSLLTFQNNTLSPKFLDNSFNNNKTNFGSKCIDKSFNNNKTNVGSKLLDVKSQHSFSTREVKPRNISHVHTPRI